LPLPPPSRIQHYEEGATEETCKVNLDSIKEHCVVARMRHTFHEQQICRYHESMTTTCGNGLSMSTT
jgi:hypothetical protein